MQLCYLHMDFIKLSRIYLNETAWIVNTTQYFQYVLVLQ